MPIFLCWIWHNFATSSLLLSVRWHHIVLTDGTVVLLSCSLTSFESIFIWYGSGSGSSILRLNTDPDSGFDYQIEKIYSWKTNLYFLFWSKTTIYLSLGLHKGRSSYIFALLDPDKDPATDPLTWLNPDPIRNRKTTTYTLYFCAKVWWAASVGNVAVRGWAWRRRGVLLLLPLHLPLAAARVPLAAYQLRLSHLPVTQGRHYSPLTYSDFV